VSSRNGSDSDEKLALREQKLLDAMVALLADEKELLSSLFGVSPQSKSKADSVGLNSLRLKILKDVPAFIGTDMKEYGPFDAGTVVELPNSVAKLFLDRKLAQAKE